MSNKFTENLLRNIQAEKDAEEERRNALRLKLAGSTAGIPSELTGETTSPIESYDQIPIPPDPENYDDLQGRYSRGAAHEQLQGSYYDQLLTALQTGADLSRGEKEQFDNLTDQINDQEKGLSGLEGLLSKVRGEKSRVDLSPLMALADAWMGTNMTSQYRRPRTPEEKDALIAKLEDAINDRKAKALDRKLKILMSKHAIKNKRQELINSERYRQTMMIQQAMKAQQQQEEVPEMLKLILKNLPEDEDKKAVLQAWGTRDNPVSQQILRMHGFITGE